MTCSKILLSISLVLSKFFPAIFFISGIQIDSFNIFLHDPTISFEVISLLIKYSTSKENGVSLVPISKEQLNSLILP